METMNVHDAVQAAIDPYGINGASVSPIQPTANEVIERLAKLGFEVVERPRIVFARYAEPRTGIEQYQAEDR